MLCMGVIVVNFNFVITAIAGVPEVLAACPDRTGIALALMSSPPHKSANPDNPWARSLE